MMASDSSTLQDRRIGYFMVLNVTPSMFIGGLMVVDGRGLPVEFRYTEPVEPSRIQQILYGAALSKYLKRDVILKTLISSIESRLDLLIVGEEHLLADDLSQAAQCPVVRLTATSNKPLLHVGDVDKISQYEFLMQLTAQSNPVRLQMKGDDRLPDATGVRSLPDKEGGIDAFKDSDVARFLFDVGQSLEVTEPVERVEKALRELSTELKPQGTRG
ncbi:MAG: hypothetical protein KC476_04950 [Cyanobacteria bacterium HKST-UBA06]|nr:hypothetical protein [Cyanobacteria bacterium HKST-UBA05]MCA9807285.1 hypothetical protein [Cyanobacteria bacterium HKST-UBA06]